MLYNLHVIDTGGRGAALTFSKGDRPDRPVCNERGYGMCLHPAGQPGRSLNISELCGSSLGCRQTHVPLMDCRSNFINTECTAHFTSSSDGPNKRPETTEITAAGATDAEFLPVVNVCLSSIVYNMYQ